MKANLFALVNFPRQGHGRFEEVVKFNTGHRRRQKSFARSFKTLPKIVVVNFKKPKSCFDNFEYNPRLTFENKVEFVAKTR